jgi:hypothetical protein
LPVSASPSDESDFSAEAAEDDGGEFIGVFFETEFDFNSCLQPNDISNLVNNCLADIPLGKFALYANERPLEKSWDGKRQTQSSGGQGPCSTNSSPRFGNSVASSLARELFIPAVAAADRRGG